MGRLWLLPSVLVVLLVVPGPLLAWARLVDPFVGFRMYLLGTALAALSAIGLGGAAAVASALGRSWRSAAVRGAAVPLIVTLLGVGATWGRERWPFHEVSTDLEEVPAFSGGPPAGAEMPEEVKAAQRDLYPDLEPITLSSSPAETFRRAEQVARAMPRWEVTHSDPGAGLLQVRAESRLFRFVDDVVIRVRPGPSGARIDVRSRSRVGQSDLGANRARVRAFADRLRD